MNLTRYALDHRPTVLAFVTVLLIIGTYNFGTMSRREDPEITIREALIVTPWPGAPAARVEELVTDPIEEVVVEIPEIETVKSKSMVGLSVIQVTANDNVSNTEQVWDDLRAKVEKVQVQLPAILPPPFVNSDFGDVFEIVFGLYQVLLPNTHEKHTYTPRDLEIFAERIEEELELIDSVARVEFWGNQPERIYVEVDSSDWAQLGITAGELQDLFQGRNIIFPGGELDTETGRYAINPTGEFTSVEQMGELVVGRSKNQLPVRLTDLPFTIQRRYEEPPRSLTRLSRPDRAHQPCIAIGVSMKSGNNVVRMSSEVDRVVDRLRSSVLPPDVGLTRVNDLPRQVNTRIGNFRINLFQGVVIVLLVALITMGWRPALIMATAVPLSMLGAFAIVRSLGIELEQFSIASLIIALGMVVDNAIVVTDNAARLIRDGMSKVEAVAKSGQDLAVPVLTSTLTTIAVFIPMLTITGNVGEYIGSLPVVLTATLTASYFTAMLVTPIMCVALLKSTDSTRRKKTRFRFFVNGYDSVIRWCLQRPAKVVLASCIAFVLSLMLLPLIGSQFFPAGARDQFFIKVWLPEGSPIGATSEVARRVEQVLIDESPAPDDVTIHRLANVLTFIGTGGPRLMITQEPEYDYPYYAFLVVNTTDAAYTEAFSEAVSARLAGFPEARITVDRYMLGPPVKDPVAFRLSGPNRDVISRHADDMVRAFKETPGVINPYSNWGAPAYQVEVAIDAYAANLAGVSNADIAMTTSNLLSGMPLTTFREGDHSVPVVLRTLREKRENLGDLADIYVNGQFGKVPLDSIAELIPSWQSSVIARRNGIPTVTVGARIEKGLLPNSVASRVQPKLEKMLESLPKSYFIEQDGELEESAKAQGKIVRAVGISLVLMILVLIVQYNSVMKPIVILFSVPMGIIGVLIGLFTTGWAMGFMAMLGVLSLGGIVINNSIILVDFIETEMAHDRDLRSAVALAGRLRMRPIILTTVTTIGGLLPLSLFGGALWAPMTNGMIFGLLVSTFLTLFVVPSLYVLFVEKLGMKVGSKA